MAEPKIIWLASYPKSGNTWFRAFLHAYFNDGKVDLRNLAVKALFSSKSILESQMDTSMDDLKPQEIEWMQSRCWQSLSDEANKPFFVKIHDAFTYSKWTKTPVIPPAASKMAIYLVRNPLDVTVSFANHQRMSTEKIVKKYLNNPAAVMGKNNRANSVCQQALTNWSAHVNSWLDQSHFPVHCVRYEDLINDPIQTFRQAMQAAGFPWDTTIIERAVAASRFEHLKKQERERGFPEKGNSEIGFFYKGEIGAGYKVLPLPLQEIIVNAHRKTMERMGYLSTT
jgi:hypothetical protein